MQTKLKVFRLIDQYVIAFILNFTYLFLAPRRQGRETDNIKNINGRKILAIKFPGLGNIVMILPLIRELKRTHPNSIITFLTLKRNAELFDGLGLIERGIFLETTPLWKAPFSAIEMFINVMRGGYDIALDFEQFLQISALIAIASGAKIRVGFETKSQRRTSAYTHKISYSDRIHMREEFKKIIQACGVFPENIERFDFPITKGQMSKIEKVLQDNRVISGDYLIAVSAGSGPNFLERRWGFERYATLCDRLIDYGKGYIKVILIGSEDETRLARNIKRIMRNEPIDLVGRLSIREAIYLIEKSNLVISNDTATVHMANSVGTPVCALYGPNTPILYGPRGTRDFYFYNKLNCSPCITNDNQKFSSCNHALCMESIQTQEVFERLREKIPEGHTPNNFKILNRTWERPFILPQR